MKLWDLSKKCRIPSCVKVVLLILYFVTMLPAVVWVLFENTQLMVTLEVYTITASFHLNSEAYCAYFIKAGETGVHGGNLRRHGKSLPAAQSVTNSCRVVLGWVTIFVSVRWDFALTPILREIICKVGLFFSFCFYVLETGVWQFEVAIGEFCTDKFELVLLLQIITGG